MSRLKIKIYNYEVSPPKNTWEKIAAALDESHIENEFPAKLYNSVITPPANAWDNILISLDEENTKVIPISRKSFTFFRYAAAATVVGIIAFGIIKITDNKSNPEGLLTTKKISSPASQKIAEPEETNIAEKNTEKENIPPEENNAFTASNDKIRTLQIKKIKNRYHIPENIEPADAIYAYNEHTPNLADRYFMLMTPNGIIRMSKKLANIVCCVAGEEQDEDCKDQLKKWQEKIAASPIAPAPGNVMDILSLVSSLDENEL